ncbi:M23 family metallopeptidase [Clostridium formicaceticum]|uniref:Murein DD-endopeptidase MepM n=1 Tax=Clostridium formicaceticum TaxID=1497 RepID=A0AAC9WI53_9CLOT|nr:M23 family metallopeptidase [Clostridium formicaceticum]AOY75338.1 peptidase M23 [Clostridium formicaceticum]ARE89787.1 Murein DD-endopeptidase MepM [Clostridium formicaceticum]
MEIYQRIVSICEKTRHRAENLLKNKVDKKAATYTVIICTIIAIGFMLTAGKAYEAQLNGKVLAVVKHQDEFTEAIEDVKKEVQTLYGHEFLVPNDIEWVETKAKKQALTDKEAIINNIKRLLDMKVKAIAIVIDGTEVAFVRDELTADAILGEVKNLFADKEMEYNYIGFNEKVELKEVGVNLADVKNKEEVFQLMTKGTDEVKSHEVASGESAWIIAQRYNLSIEDIAAANPNINPERLQIGQEISLVVPKPYVTVVTKEYIELVETIPFETEHVETESLYKGDKKITVQGEEGKKEIKGYLVKENGVFTQQEIIEEIILQEPTTRVIAEGVKERPATVATGSFIRPTRGTLTSGFGTRWGRRHEGIDIGASTGTPITSADAGRVSFAGMQGAYGNLVIIDHENGYQTYYAHASKLLVKKGDRVFKGQEIAKVGSTGRSTGPHLHFEVRKNGVPTNPLQFVKY